MLEKYIISNDSIIASNEGNIFYYYNLKEDEKKQIINDFSIDAHTLTSALDPDEVARMETDNGKISLIIKIPSRFRLGDESSLDIFSIGIFYVNEKLIFLSLEDNNYLDERLNLHISSLFDIILGFQNNVIKHFIEHLKIIKQMSREIQNKINKSMGNEHLLHMFNLSEILVFYIDALNSNKIVLSKFYEYSKTRNLPINFNYFSDLIIENEQASKQAEIYSQIFAGLMDARGSIINNNMNTLIKNLTIINIIFLPLNLIAGIGGMSEFSSMTKGIPWPISYTIFIITMVIIGWLTMLFITRIGKNKIEGKSPYSRQR